jgi:DNA topoisomerase-3
VVDPGAKKQLEIIKTLIEREDVEDIISATDFDREGELIALLIFKYLQTDKPIYRLLINEWTPEEVKRGLEGLKSNEQMRSLQDSGLSRQLADWVIGINFTSVATMKFTRGKGNLLNIGRVLMPTLKMIYDRDMQIKNFNSQEFFEAYATFENESGSYKGKFFHGKNDKFSGEKNLERLKEEIQGKDGKITEKTVEINKENPPSQLT